MAHKNKRDWEKTELWCHVALLLAPKWSPYRLLWRFGIWYAKKKKARAIE